MARREEELRWPEDRSSLRVMNREVRRVEAPDKVSGRARYTHDVRLPGMVYARLLCCPHPTAEYELDLAAAGAIEGVIDARPLDELQGSTRWLGQPVAVVTATSPEIAGDGVRAIEARWGPLPFAVDYEGALRADAPKVHRQGNVSRFTESGDREAAEEALAGCEAAISATYTVPVELHDSLEVHGVVVDYRGGDSATVYASTQGVSGVPGAVARALGLEAGAITAVCEHMGGGFGSKLMMGVEASAAARVAKDLERPVHLMLTREQELLMTGNRSGGVQTLRAGAGADGKLRALVAEVSKLGGIGLGSNPGQPFCYEFPAETTYASARSVLTHTDSSRPFRAPGRPQASFAIESAVDELAYALKADPLELRKKNLPGEVWQRQLDGAAERIGWADHPHKTDFDRSDDWEKTGIGFAVSAWGYGGAPPCGCQVRIGRDRSVEARSGIQDLGTGSRTVVATIVAEELGREVSQVRAKVGNSDYGPGCASGGSMTTPSVSPVVKDAAHKARVELLARAAEGLGCEPGELELVPEGVRQGGEVRLSWREACALLGPDGITASSEGWTREVWGRIQHLSSVGVQGAQAARVEVDTLTGEVRVLDMVCVQNLGLPVNRTGVRSQMQGAMVMSLGYGLLEQRVIDPESGLALNASMGEYKIAGAQEVPRIEAIVDEEDLDRGVIGVGEPPVIPGQSAIANAVYNACGVRVRDLPVTPDKILNGLAALGGKR